ncbi:Nicotinamide riboside transporter PnuC [invertebrate metagenome]|uniref:Nicotinamide riboside transporter PnuC n=1 Tax=invertebrate metagenome TaxID=1711999 RepID=A0A2H9T5E4_9ZZZZ
MDLSAWYDINNTLVNIPIGDGYAMSWIEAIGTLCGLLCIWFASKEKTVNFFFGLLNVTLFAIIFYQIQLYAALLLQLFFFSANVYGWYAWTRTTDEGENTLKIRWMSKAGSLWTAVVSVMAVVVLSLYIDPFFSLLAHITIDTVNLFGANLTLTQPEPDAFPFWDSAMTVLSVVAQILMTRKFIENWPLWIIVNLISVVLYTAQGVYAMAIEYTILLFIAAEGTRSWIKMSYKSGYEEKILSDDSEQKLV